VENALVPQPVNEIGSAAVAPSNIDDIVGSTNRGFATTVTVVLNVELTAVPLRATTTVMVSLPA
jgi:hypothetical protein